MHATEQPPLSQRLRQVTAAHHTRVERSGPMPALLRGELGLTAYCMLLRNLHPIYRDLEAALARHAAHPGLAGLDIDGLPRSTALEADLATLHGDSWADALPLVNAAADYAARLRELSASRPELLLAHVYVRYLGDLQGGQILQRIVARCFALDGETGTRFYRFGVHAPAELSARLRAALDGPSRDDATQADIAREAEAAFLRHVDIFEALPVGDAAALRAVD
ncbi:heme oxygenase (biliverdin-producing) [Methyloversatilis sp.]|uniref:biliverdin-producing heme oxygenase n=1 Tax=Methyloversatilis sp. TaxID=2569862 RepID=UPI003D2DEBFE